MIKSCIYNTMLKHTHLIYRFYVIIFIVLAFISQGCKDNPSGPDGNINSNYEIAYHRWINNNWEIYLNSLSRNTSKNISNFSYEDSDCKWSPDGKSIVYTHFNNRAADIYLYNIKTNENINLTPDDTYISQAPVWSPDGKSILFSYHKVPESQCTYIMNYDGSNKRKLLDYEAKIYFFADCNNFLYKPVAVFDERENYIYKTNIDRTYNELILDLRTVAHDYATVFDFNTRDNKLLILASDEKDKPNFIITYDLTSKTIDTLIKAGEDHSISCPRYSHDFTKIALYEYTSDYKSMRLCLFDLKAKPLKYLLDIASSEEWLDFRPPVFSPNDKYLAYVKNTNQPGPWFTWKSSLYIMELSTGKIQY
ncbi:MAG: hypothetical protein Q8940_22750, partial [Bacteroidota bacterium]|nr:hypothetical protein [Bacteroidota bacterium]